MYDYYSQYLVNNYYVAEFGSLFYARDNIF